MNAAYQNVLLFMQWNGCFVEQETNCVEDFGDKVP